MVIVQYGHKQAHMDGYLRTNLELYKKMVKNNRDLVFIVTGREREGKSTLANGILSYLDPTYSLDRCCFTGQEFLNAIKNAKNGEAIGYDEAHEFSSRSAISRFNKVINQALSMIGIKQLYIAICIPSFFELDKYPAIHRSNFLLRVFSVKGKRGYFEFWNWEKKKMLYLLGKKVYNYSAVKPVFHGSFAGHIFPFDEDKYNTKKLAAIEAVNFDIKKRDERWKRQRDILIRYLYKERGKTEQDIADILTKEGEKVSHDVISEAILAKS